jgi:hypothetical protein
LPEQIGRIGSGPFHQCELHQQFRPDVSAMHNRCAQPFFCCCLTGGGGFD